MTGTTDSIRFAFFTNTPAHVHLYKHTVEYLEQSGYKVRVMARDYGCTKTLLNYYDLPYQIYGKCDTEKNSLVKELPNHFYNIFLQMREFEPYLIFGMGGYSAFAGAVTRTPVVSVLDSEPTSIDYTASKPFVSAFLTPHAFRKDLGNKHYRFTGFKETAYLHPDVYSASDEDVREKLQVGEVPYIVLRFNAFGSHHDVNHAGFSREQKETLINELSQYGSVFVSDEGDSLDIEATDGYAFELHPALMHDALANADLLVADTQTMVTEAALLGTPAIRSNSFVGDSDMGNFKELEKQGLIYNLEEFEDVLQQSIALLEDSATAEKWEQVREEYLSEKVNLTKLILDITTAFATEDDVEVVKIIRDHPQLHQQ